MELSRGEIEDRGIDFVGKDRLSFERKNLVGGCWGQLRRR